ncbi:uncharacterized protein Dvir_GJ26282, isoform B [Drosophila virilis]|uniref:Uncharacterized protein, isoform A n=1 Tax=Drosophila virilis TaxID=7244 RepID=A0A0Q9VYW0_DROVI|nr:spindle pole body component 110 [Drosophila virilis]XP_015025383.1 spindle pole body component 110 [Drosophila virilis]KRF78028.1 uncharacterized protein Dvir_GJ26282, isoform A [Drosophila virilis]KRF78029.1 uncharacterized protein Dvir_GJ26282, isoform B [Drosophila virilis]
MRVLLMLVLIETNYGREQLSHCTSSNEIETQCGTYCYKIVQPLLQHAVEVYSKEQQFVELQNKIHELERTIINMTVQQAQHAMKDDLIATKNELINQLQLNVLEKEAQITKLKNQNSDQVILRNLTTEQETLRTLVNNKVEIIESKEKQLTDQSKLIETLQKSNEHLLDMLKAENNTLSYESKKKNEEIASLQSEVSELEKQVSDLKTQLKTEKPQATRPETKSLKDPLSDDSTKLCDASHTAPGWIVVQRRLNGSVSFHRG